MRRLPAALALLVFVAALGVGASLCGPPRAVAEASEDCCPGHEEPEPSDLGCAPVCQTCAVLPAPARLALVAPLASIAPAGAESLLTGFTPAVDHVPIA